MRVNFNVLPPSVGLEWMARAWMRFKKYPMVLLTMTATCVGVVFLLSRISTLGPFAILFLTPFMIVTLYSAYAAIRGGGAVSFGKVFKPCLKWKKSLIFLGLAYMILFLAVDGVLVTLKRIFPEALVFAEQDLAFLLLAALLYFLAALACLFAPVLVVWQEENILRAMGRSFLACVENWRALAFNLIFMIAFCTFSLAPALVFFFLHRVNDLAVFRVACVAFGVVGALVAISVVAQATFFSYRSFFIAPEEESEEGASTLSTFFY